MMRFVLLFVVITSVLADIYMHNPRGSNNRLNEKTQNRANANRLFDSQNNEKGGYNTGDRLDKAAGTNPRLQYSMQYYGSGGGEDETSDLVMEWTNQHGCGDNPVNYCELVVQYMCMDNGTDDTYPQGKPANKASRPVYMRDGTVTQTQGYTGPANNESPADYEKRMKSNRETQITDDRGLHETVWWYDQCKYREANGGLFTADQKLKKDVVGYISATRTRQNPNGQRRGFECPEERDYYPYWLPTLQAENSTESQRTPWIDLAWLGDEAKCDFIQQNSFNQKSRFRCVLSGTRTYGKSINEIDCGKEGGKWVEFNSFLEIIMEAKSESACEDYAKNDDRNNIAWMKLRNDSDLYRCVVQAPLPQCKQAPTTRINHLGNSEIGTEASKLHLALPHFPSKRAKRCVLRIRYNITTMDYNPHITDSRFNNKKDVIENDPEVDVLGNGEPMELALNTAQTGRTFQDRSHVFVILPRTESMSSRRIHNLNVRGKRGNIVQVYPAVEYDFVPNNLTFREEDLVHIQWTGSNTHNGDGEGTEGTDRSNFLLMKHSGVNYPKTINESMGFWEGIQSLNHPDALPRDIAIGLATAGFYCGSTNFSTCPNEYSMLNRKGKIDNKMNNAPASYFGHVLKIGRKEKTHYVCTRNNNFSNRGQKGSLSSNTSQVTISTSILLLLIGYFLIRF